MYGAKDEITVQTQTALVVDRKKVSSLPIWERELCIGWIYRI